MGSSGFAHISDLHLSDPGRPAVADLVGKRLLGWLSWRSRRRFEHRPEILDRLVTALAARRPGTLLVSGDLTQIGLPAEFVAARHFLGRLGPPEDVLLVPGNHDSYGRAPVTATYAHWRDYLGGTGPDGLGPRSDRRGPLLFVGLDSACPTPIFSARGRLGRGQLEALDRLLAVSEAEDLFRVVYLHHPPEPKATGARKRLADGAALLEILERRGVELVLHGHQHRPRYGAIRSAGREIPVIGIASASALGGGDDERRAAINCFQIARDGAGWVLELEPLRHDPQAEAFLARPGRTFAIAPRSPLGQRRR